ncbi:MAG TPA: M14 family metallopeptidase [Candidatus Acidoferrales bacterium]|nr:M14 family metallopeptidase [Candidatus Acidoferrales bacterium]
MRVCKRFVSSTPLFVLAILLALCAAGPATPRPPAAATPTPLENAFSTGWMIVNTNGDGVPDFLRGHIIVPADSSAGENTAAANLAARVSYGTTGLTLPVVVSGGDAAASAAGPKIYVGSGALPANAAGDLAPLVSLLGAGEGGVFSSGQDVAVVGSDVPGLLAAAGEYASRAPYQWATPGETLDAIAKRVNEAFASAKVNATARLVGLTYADKEQAIHRAILDVSGAADAAAVRRALAPEGEPPLRFAAVRELILRVGGGPPVDLLNPNPLGTRPLGPMAAPEGKPLDLGELYTMKGLLGGSAKKMIASSVTARLYVPAGTAGVAMANLAARIGLETTGISLPFAFVPSGVGLGQVPAQALLTADSPLGQQLQRELTAPHPGAPSTFAQTVFQPLQPGEGELRVIDNAFAKHAAVVARGDAAGQAAALDYAARRLPYLWEPTKRQESIDEMRYDIHRFFSLRSAAGQAAAAMYHLSRWLKQAQAGSAKPASVDATLYVDRADPKLAGFIRQQLEQQAPGVKVDVHAGSLHAGLKCCASDPPLHYVSPLHPFEQAAPTFTDDFTIPWEGRRLLDAVRQAAAHLERGQPANLLAEVSEGPAMRQKLTSQLRDVLVSAGAAPARTRVEVLCAYKPGYSWLMDEIAPALRGQAVSRIVIEFAPDSDPQHTSLLYSHARWLQELYPVDETLARELHVPLKSIEFQQLPDASGPTYRVHAYAAGGRELLARDFTVHTAERPYSNTFVPYDHVQVDTGWIHLDTAGHALLDQRLETDIEMFWEHYQTITLPRVLQFVMQQNDGDPKVEYQPLFDTLRLQIHLSEPDYNLGLDRERISSLEALEEDTFYSTNNFFYMLGTLDSSGIFDYMGRTIPVVYPSTDGQDGHIHIEFYAKDGPHPLVAMSWTDAAGHRHEDKRDLPALQMGMPQLVAARVHAGQAGVQSLTWQLPADARDDRYRDWIGLEGANFVEHSMFSAEQGEGQVHWLEAMHSAGLYPDSLAYPNLRRLAIEFALPRPLRAAENSRPELVRAEWAVPEPATKRPQITDYTPVPVSDDAEGHFVSWDEPISPEKSAQILARLATFPGVNVYWMGRTYLGENIWAADIMTPSPAALRSVAKEETLKAVIIYSGRQHADEVSSTSHILRLAEQLVRDPATKKMLDKVNVVIHPITNPDGANLSIDLMHITPDFVLHPGYHGALTADVSSGQSQPDPIYPESRTRRLLWEAWLPDTFLNPHGYPSHEWVQPFSGYTAWMTRRTGVEGGRTWWIPRGWFTSLGYLGDPDHPRSKDIAYELRARMAESFAKVPGALALESRMDDRYERYGVRWEPRSFQQPLYKGVRIYMALKGQREAPGGGGFMGRFPDVTWDEGYTEAPDETAHQAYLHLVAGMGLAFDRVHLTYLAGGKFKITRTEKEFTDGVSWTVDRQRPILPEKWTIQPGPGIAGR